MGKEREGGGRRKGRRGGRGGAGEGWGEGRGSEGPSPWAGEGGGLLALVCSVSVVLGVT